MHIFDKCILGESLKFKDKRKYSEGNCKLCMYYINEKKNNKSKNM